MRITGGLHRSRKLETPKGNAVRPTSDKVRQAVFNMLNSRGVVQDAVVLDAFCGTGALGLEALSQGAQFCSFFDVSRESVALCKFNIAALKEEEKSRVMIGDVTKAKPRPADMMPATLVFLDPPYHKNLVPQAIQSLADNNWLSEDAFFVIETAKDEVLQMPLLDIQAEKIYGDTKIILANLKMPAID